MEPKRKTASNISSHSQFVAFFQVDLFLPQISGLAAFVGKVFASRKEIKSPSLILKLSPSKGRGQNPQSRKKSVRGVPKIQIFFAASGIFWCFSTQKTLFLAQKVNGKKLKERGCTPLPPLTGGWFPKIEQKKVNGKRGYPPSPLNGRSVPKNRTEKS